MNSNQGHRRHDISDEVWEKLEPLLPGRAGSWGGIAEDNRRFINGVFYILRHGIPWRDLPPDGKTPTAASAVGATRDCGNPCLKW